MRVNRWRLLGALLAIVVVITAALVIANGLMTDALLNAVHERNADRVQQVLRYRPALATMKVFPQGSSRSASRSQWRGRYLIHDAVAAGDLAVVQTLANTGADLSVRLEGDSLLHLAASNRDVAMMRWLIDRGLDINDRNNCNGCDRRGRTPLHAAQQADSADVNAFLLSHGADVNATDARGRTPLHSAALDGGSGGAIALCAHGADPTRRDEDGHTPADLARATDKAGRRNALAETLGAGELAGWLEPDGGCQQLGARAGPSAPASQADIAEIWGAYAATRR